MKNTISALKEPDRNDHFRTGSAVIQNEAGEF